MNKLLQKAKKLIKKIDSSILNGVVSCCHVGDNSELSFYVDMIEDLEKKITWNKDILGRLCIAEKLEKDEFMYSLLIKNIDNTREDIKIYSSNLNYALARLEEELQNEKYIIYK